MKIGFAWFYEQHLLSSFVDVLLCFITVELPFFGLFNVLFRCSEDDSVLNKCIFGIQEAVSLDLFVIIVSFYEK